MRLVVKQGDSAANEFRFAKGPVYIGRHTNSQVFLPDRVVSRHHAVLFSTQDGKWMVEDLDSANKTYLNEKAIHKAEIKTGDCLRITDFTIEINIEDGTEVDKKIDLEDTLTKTAYGLEDTSGITSYEPQIIVRRPGSDHASDMRLPAKRVKDFVQATEAICKANGLDEVLHALLRIAARQFNAYRIWCALRSQHAGPMTCHAGKQRDGSAVELDEIKLNEKITQAIEKKQFLLLPRIRPQGKKEKETIHSVMIAPVMGQAGCFGALYIDNDMSHEHYTLSDLDYLMLIAIHTAAILENF